MHDAFSDCHPVVNFFYFALVIAFTMCLHHPAALLIALLSAAIYVMILRGRKGLRQQLRWLLPTALLAAVINPAFSIYRLDDRDRGLLLWLGFCGVYLISGAIAGGFRFWYYPAISGAEITPVTVSFFAVYGLLCLTPVILDLYTARQWKLQRKEGSFHE